MLVFKTTTKNLAVLLRADTDNDVIEMILGEQVGPGFHHRFLTGLSHDEAGQLRDQLNAFVEANRYDRVNFNNTKDTVHLRVRGNMEFTFGRSAGTNSVEVQPNVCDNMANMIEQLLDHLEQARKDKSNHPWPTPRSWYGLKEDQDRVKLTDTEEAFRDAERPSTLTADQKRVVADVIWHGAPGIGKSEKVNIEPTPRDLVNYLELQLKEVRDQLGTTRELVKILLKEHPEIVKNFLVGEDYKPKGEIDGLDKKA